jgi:sirohydrochlorin cobaltochelatase
VDLAFLEFMSPTLVEAGARMAAQGCTQVTVVPLFLGAGGHVRKDLPLLLQQLGEQHPGVRWTLSPAVGETDILVQALADAAAHLAAQHRGAP